MTEVMTAEEREALLVFKVVVEKVWIAPRELDVRRRGSDGAFELAAAGYAVRRGRFGYDVRDIADRSEQRSGYRTLFEALQYVFIIHAEACFKRAAAAEFKYQAWLAEQPKENGSLFD